MCTQTRQKLQSDSSVTLVLDDDVQGSGVLLFFIFQVIQKS